MSGNFYQIGNLAFYEGWSADYVYFKSLLKAHEVFNTKNTDHSWWDAKAAGAVATQAIADANVFSNLNGQSKEEMDDHFLSKMKEIIAFLEKAYQYELNNEIAWAKNKINTMKKLFDKEFKNVPEIQEIITMLQHPENGIDYDKFNALINIIMSGVKNAKIMAQYESERITELEKIIDQLMKSRANQTRGVLYSRGKSVNEQEEGASAAVERLWRNISDEYKMNPKLGQTKKITVEDKATHTKKTKTKYRIFGGGQLKKVKATADTVLANWAEQVIQDIINKPEIISKMAAAISSNLLFASGNFKLLEDEIRQIIIIAIIQYGMNNLETVLYKEIDDIILDEIEHTLLTDASYFDDTRKLNITGLKNDFGQKIIKSNFLEDVETLDQLEEKHALELYSEVEKIITASSRKQDQQNTLLYQALTSPAAKNGEGWKQITEIIELIHSVEKIQEAGKEMLTSWKKKAKDKRNDMSKQMKLSNDSTITITITIHNGEIIVDDKAILEALNENPTFKQMGFKSFTATSLRYIITGLKRRATLELKQEIKDVVRSGVLHLPEKELIASLRNELNDLKIDIKGFDVAELINAISFRQQGKRIYVEYAGPRHGKNDTIVIQVNYRGIMQKINAKLSSKLTDENRKEYLQLYAAIENAAVKFQTAYEESINEQISNVNTSNKEESEDRYTKVAEKMFSTLRSREGKMGKVKDLMWDKVDEFIDFIKRYKVIDKDTLNEIEKELSDVMQNSFYISSTVKSYNTYMNRIGFHGGSLGGNLDSQLNQIADIFKNANTPIDDADLEWIRSAIINCFPGSIVGEKNKNLIEQYLGSLMAFALFDEGGAESAIISNFYKTYFDAIDSGSSAGLILHLYRTNTIYVPGSLIIKRTLDTLSNEVIPMIENIPNTMTRGAGITIINKTDESVIPNRPISSFYGPPNNQAWTIAGQGAQERVSLKILFLAGLLDIVNGINQTLANIEIPQ